MTDYVCPKCGSGEFYLRPDTNTRTCRACRAARRTRWRHAKAIERGVPPELVGVGRIYRQQRRFSVDELLKYARLYYGLDDAATLWGDNSAFARAIGVPRGTVARWRREGGVPEFRADEAAVRLGVHPANIWPEWLDTEEDVA